MFNSLIHRINKKIALSLEYKGRVIDLGCGTSPYKREILYQANEYIGVDWENSFHDQSNVDIFADISKPLPFPDNYADTLVSFQVIEHLPEPKLFLRECNRILVPGGKLILTVPFMWHVHEAPHDYYRFTRHGLKYLLKTTDFENIDIQENTGFWQMWFLKLNYHTQRFAIGPIKYTFMPLWWIGQLIAPILDKYDNNPNECASYTAIATK